jgi:competence protein ComEC
VFQVIFMDAGQGDATLLRYPDGSLVLVDCGSKKNKQMAREQIGELLPWYLAATGNRLKALVLTHPDGDHCNLIDQLIVKKGTQVDFVVIGGQIGHYSGLASWLTGKQNELRRATGDPTAQITLGWPHVSSAVVPQLSHLVLGNDRVETRILAANVGGEPNSWSIVLFVHHRTLNLLLMGDATDVTEDAIIRAHIGPGSWLANLLNDRGRMTVLKVGHHGSDTSSSDPWIRAVQPDLAFVSSDTKGFGRAGTSIPRKEVLDLILAVGNIKNDAEPHYYVQYDSSPGDHELAPPGAPTTRAMFTTLHRLVWENHRDFEAHGTSWYLRILDNGEYTVMPACGWPQTRIRDPRPA